MAEASGSGRPHSGTQGVSLQLPVAKAGRRRGFSSEEGSDLDGGGFFSPPEPRRLGRKPSGAVAPEITIQEDSLSRTSRTSNATDMVPRLTIDLGRERSIRNLAAPFTSAMITARRKTPVEHALEELSTLPRWDGAMGTAFISRFPVLC
jgi:hypothetical protein